MHYVLRFALTLPIAISEECSDELLGSSATSSPPNGFMAPLKKRRVVRQCSDLNSEDVPSPKEDVKEDIKDPIAEEGKFQNHHETLSVGGYPFDQIHFD